MVYFAKKQRLKTVLEIGSSKAVNREHTLLVEVGKTFCYAAFLHKPTATLNRIWLTSFDEFRLGETVPEIFRYANGSGVESAIVCSAFPQALLYPAKLFQDDYAVLRSVYDEPVQDCFHDRIPEWQMVNVYSVPQGVSRFAAKFFSDVQYFHAYTPSIKIYNGYVAENQLSVHFAEGSFRVLLKKAAHIHLAQTYTYQGPLDVIYYLLKICAEFGLLQQEVHLVLSGLVEKSSRLFSDLQQYFAHLHFAQQPEISLPQSPHPHYYFTSLYNLAACAL